ncbi:Circadian clock-controlled protein [Eumeta japonica]|uniref:Circadian clock-controlled protein n=1 Tax=Eumeta variegata TaxID=151549 RepID=A0A4C1WCB3_EUMVA|nr:Circadian clock-controlled protein [Eumeta japonica]
MRIPAAHSPVYQISYSYPRGSGNALATLLGLSLFMGGGDHLLFDGSHARLPHDPPERSRKNPNLSGCRLLTTLASSKPYAVAIRTPPGAVECVLIRTDKGRGHVDPGGPSGGETCKKKKHTEVPHVEKCHLEDSECLKTSVQKAIPAFVTGIPELGVEVLDVMEEDEVNFDLAGLQFSLKGGKLKGLKNAIVDRIKWDMEKRNILFEFHLNVTVSGHYKAGGRVLILPIIGEGNMKLKLKNLAVKLTLDYEMKKGEDGKEVIVPNDYRVRFEVKDNAHFALTNLFNGNAELSSAMLTFLNENWKQVSQEFGTPLVEAAARKLYKNVVIFLEHVPIWDIALK